MWLERLHDWVNQGMPCALATIIEAQGSTPRGPGSNMAVNVSGEIAGSVGGGAVEQRCLAAALEVMAAGVPQLLRFALNGQDWSVEGLRQDYGVCGGTVAVFIEPVLPPQELVAFGGGHVSQCLGRLARALGMPFRVYDDRPGFATPELFPGARQTVLGPYDDLAGHIRLGPSSHCVILTHGHAHDEAVLEQLLRIPGLPYIGMIGSATKVRRSFALMRERGLEPDGRVFSPVGLALGGRLPGDIALSILAEVRMMIHGGPGGHLRLAPETGQGAAGIMEGGDPPPPSGRGVAMPG
jgi:xanthine dehydrogenase accessory factor